MHCYTILWNVDVSIWILMFTSTLCSEKNTHSRFILYLRGKCSDLHKFFRVCLRGLKYSMDIKIKYSFNFFATDDVILTSCLHVCEIMGFRIEDKHLIKCLRVSSSSEYLILTSMECLITYQHTLKILYKSRHFPPRYKRKTQVGVSFVWTSDKNTQHMWKMLRFV